MPHTQTILHAIFLIFAGTAALATLALFTRQSLLIAYMAMGAILGPWGFGLIKDSSLIQQTGDIGIVFLLFLLGLNLQPQNLYHSLRKMSMITFVSSLLFFITGFVISLLFGFTWVESALVGSTMMFSSTIIGLKLLPTTVLHHQHTGELMISILLLQDLIAIGILLALQAVGDHSLSLYKLTLVLLAVPTLLIIGYLFERYILTNLLKKFDKIQEYNFILSIGWCLCMTELANGMGLSEEIGAFIAGVAIASNPISLYIADSLKPLRDFFLVIFFFTIGAGFNFGYLPQVIFPAVVLATFMLVIKPLVFHKLLEKTGETTKMGWEVGIRLGQISEFSLLVIVLALQTKLVTPMISYTVQAATILTFIGSCYWVAHYYPTPLASNEKLRRD